MDTMKESAKHLTLEAGALAREAGSPKAFNVVMLGAASPYIGVAVEELEKAIGLFFERKGEEIINMNIKAFRLGKEYASE